MSGALIDLVAKGAQDVYITGNPEVSFFRQNYKRHTNFSIQPQNINYIGTFAGSNEVVVKIPSKGDLLSYVWIEAESIRATGTNSNGIYSNDDSTLFEFDLYIGGQKVVTFDSLYLQNIHDALYQTSQARASCAVTTQTAKENAVGYSGSGSDYVILPFFFSDDYTKCLPLVGLQYHEVELRIKCRAGFTAGSTPKVWAQYIFLDTDERRMFTENPQELLITQVQYVLSSNTATDVDLSYFNHPVKAVHLASGKATSSTSANDEYTFQSSSMYINGTTLFDNTSNTYHHNVVHHMHCDNIADSILDDIPVFTWPFCLSLSKHQPTGTLNFSRIDNAKLQLVNPSGGNAIHRAYAVNYNVLRIKNGMAGVAFSN